MNEFWLKRCWAGGILHNEAARCPPQGPLGQVHSFRMNNFVAKVQEKRTALSSQHCSQSNMLVAIVVKQDLLSAEASLCKACLNFFMHNFSLVEQTIPSSAL